jgi:hypothetical protein
MLLGHGEQGTPTALAAGFGVAMESSSATAATVAAASRASSTRARRTITVA